MYNEIKTKKQGIMSFLPVNDNMTEIMDFQWSVEGYGLNCDRNIIRLSYRKPITKSESLWIESIINSLTN